MFTNNTNRVETVQEVHDDGGQDPKVGRVRSFFKSALSKLTRSWEGRNEDASQEISVSQTPSVTNEGYNDSSLNVQTASLSGGSSSFNNAGESPTIITAYQGLQREGQTVISAPAYLRLMEDLQYKGENKVCSTVGSTWGNITNSKYITAFDPFRARNGFRGKAYKFALTTLMVGATAHYVPVAALAYGTASMWKFASMLSSEFIEFTEEELLIDTAYNARRAKTEEEFNLAKQNLYNFYQRREVVEGKGGEVLVNAVEQATASRYKFWKRKTGRFVTTAGIAFFGSLALKSGLSAGIEALKPGFEAFVDSPLDSLRSVSEWFTGAGTEMPVENEAGITAGEQMAGQKAGEMPNEQYGTKAGEQVEVLTNAEAPVEGEQTAGQKAGEMVSEQDGTKAGEQVEVVTNAQTPVGGEQADTSVDYEDELEHSQSVTSVKSHLPASAYNTAGTIADNFGNGVADSAKEAAEGVSFNQGQEVVANTVNANSNLRLWNEGFESVANTITEKSGLAMEVVDSNPVIREVADGKFMAYARVSLDGQQYLVAVDYLTHA